MLILGGGELQKTLIYYTQNQNTNRTFNYDMNNEDEFKENVCLIMKLHVATCPMFTSLVE